MSKMGCGVYGKIARSVVTLSIFGLVACGKSEPEHASAEAPAQAASPTAVAEVARPATDVWAGLTPKTFRMQYDQLARADNADVIKTMRPVKGKVVAVIDDTHFQQTIAGLKKLDIANGRFESHSAMMLTVDKQGKIVEIYVIGDRTNPASIGQFIESVAIVNMLLNPGLEKDTNMAFLHSLQLMRGDDDPSIGQPLSAFNTGGAFTCIAQHSEESLFTACQVTPRS